MSSSKNSKHDVPPPYDQIATIDIDSGTAPLLQDTFDGSIFGTSTVVTFELARESYPTIVSDKAYEIFDKPCDYTFVIRDFLGSVQANGKVSHLSPDLNTELQDVRGTEILQVRRQVGDSIEPRDPPSVMMQWWYRATRKERENTVHTFEVFKNSMPVGVVKFGDHEPTESCLKMYLGNAGTEFIVKSFSKGDFSIFRDQSSRDPLCNLQIDPYEFTGKIVFHPETGITTEEQLLCTAAAFVFKTCLTQLNIAELNDFSFKMLFWLLASFIITLLVSYLFYLFVMYAI